MLVQLLLAALAAPVPALGSDHQLLGAGLQDPHHLKKEKERKRKNSFAVRASVPDPKTGSTGATCFLASRIRIH
jgi:hypothetical protein